MSKSLPEVFRILNLRENIGRCLQKAVIEFINDNHYFNRRYLLLKLRKLLNYNYPYHRNDSKEFCEKFCELLP